MKTGKAVKGLLIIIGFVLAGCSTTGKGTMESVSGKREKFALVIGNANYENISKLQNPKNDAQDVSDILIQLGFQVDLFFDLNYGQMKTAVDQYVGKLAQKNNAEGIVYFAGSGVIINNRNYLMPVDINADSDSQLVSGSYSVDTFLSKLITADNAVNFVIFDACFTEFPSAAHRGIVINTAPDNTTPDGLDILEKFTKDIFYLQSALPGELAMDGVFGSGNSPFTTALLNNITKSLEINELVEEIISETVKYTDGRQRPYYKANIFNHGNYKIN